MNAIVLALAFTKESMELYSFVIDSLMQAPKLLSVFVDSLPFVAELLSAKLNTFHSVLKPKYVFVKTKKYFLNRCR